MCGGQPGILHTTHRLAMTGWFFALTRIFGGDSKVNKLTHDEYSQMKVVNEIKANFMAKTL